MKIETQLSTPGTPRTRPPRPWPPPSTRPPSYAFDDTQHGADLFDLKVAGNIYTRIMNPTSGVLEQRVAALEGGVGALALASGMAAVTYSIFTIAQAGDNIVSVSTLYGGTYNLFAHTLPRLGIQVRFAAPNDIDGMAAQIDAKTKAIFCESIGNPAGNVADLKAISDLAHAHGVPVIVDNTVPTPLSVPPLRARLRHRGPCPDQVHGRPWHQHRRHPGGLAASSPGRSTRRASPCSTSRTSPTTASSTPRPWARRPTSGAPGWCRCATWARPSRPLTASCSCKGSRPCTVRMDRHCENALKVAEYLKGHPKVEWVRYAGLPDSPDYPLVQKYMDGGKASSILSFGIKGGREAGARFIDALKLAVRLVNIGDAKTLACHPATTTHRQLSPEELARAGVSEDLVRLSIGIEHIDDIIADLEQALAAAG